ncbi:unnamed protein product (macronuclear) [Paramecium tetraurelia]|uniref:Transmembrane protein n=1 Tax=Paramecium tetraurelia TaxID=5888 RepID=A0CHG5_PARTE|nr:uncharacterized protein GSPATT00038334001 [Paramecium tetraurelia]CAK70232.1 unnamed protein product [Paramecium tetraurelia]|eukprot:XP_001437629.1 hypothetical protein (macronuclear) [Paramecium tetraurelia strain d4-2]
MFIDDSTFMIMAYNYLKLLIRLQLQSFRRFLKQNFSHLAYLDKNQNIFDDDNSLVHPYITTQQQFKTQYSKVNLSFNTQSSYFSLFKKCQKPFNIQVSFTQQKAHLHMGNIDLLNENDIIHNFLRTVSKYQKQQCVKTSFGFSIQNSYILVLSISNSLGFASEIYTNFLLDINFPFKVLNNNKYQEKSLQNDSLKENKAIQPLFRKINSQTILGSHK